MRGPEEVLERLHASYDEAFDAPVSCWSTEQVAAWHAGVQALRARAEALCVHAARAAERAAVASLDPRTRTLRQHVAEHGTVDPADVSRDLELALEREAQHLADIDADPTHPERKHRGHEQRMADALANLVARGALRPDGTIPSPLVHVVIGAEVLEEQILRASAAAQGTVPVDADGRPLPDDLRIDPADPRRRCELVDGTPLHPEHVVGLLGVAEIRRLVLSARGEILDLGRAVRLFPRQLKAALLAGARGRCLEPGCDAPLAWLQADHVIPWSRGGPTATTNGTIRCAACNKAKGATLEPPWAA